MPKEYPEYEILDGWQRIKAIRDFVHSKIPMPELLDEPQKTNTFEDAPNLMPVDKTTGLYQYFSTKVRQSIDAQMIKVDVIIGIGDTTNRKHEEIARTLFEQTRDVGYWAKTIF